MTGTILVVDDERDLAATCQRLLSRRGWGVVLAASRAAAAAILAVPPPPVLAIVDRQLPDGDGVDVLRVALRFGIPVIIATGFGTAATRRLSLEEGAAGFLSKPFSAHELLDLVHRIVGDGAGPVAAPAIVPPSPPPPRLGLYGRRFS
jgi:DNA-binding response OmpR family regulator